MFLSHGTCLRVKSRDNRLPCLGKPLFILLTSGPFSNGGKIEWLFGLEENRIIVASNLPSLGGVSWFRSLWRDPGWVRFHMAGMETIGILDEIQALVSDRLQAVSYKWLSRNFLVSSNVAKKLLQEFVEKHGAGLEVVYTLSGWLKSNPSNYHIRLVSQSKLAEAKEEFEDNCSLKIYSVQTCLPKDPAVLWNAEFVQSEELFKQPAAVDNCLRDNRFCGVSNSFVKRNAGGTHVSTSTPDVKSTGVPGQSKIISLQQNPSLVHPQEKKVPQSSPSSSSHSPDVVKVVKNDNNSTGTREKNGRPADNKRNIPQLPVNKKKGPNDKNSSGTGNALANIWGRASAKQKGECAASEANDSLPNSAASADAQTCARGEIDNDNSDDDLNIKRAPKGEATRKRRVVFDCSDEEDDFKVAITLASPDLPKMEPMLGSKQSSNLSDLEKKNLGLDEEEEDGRNVKEKKEAKTNQVLKEEPSVPRKINTIPPSPEGNLIHLTEIGTNVNDKVTDNAPQSPKRRKVLRTRIDERGREVTEVVWEGEETKKKPDCQTTKKVEKATVNASKRLLVKKSPAVETNAPVNQGTKGGNRKAGNKDPKQGNILSFFKKV